MKLLVILISVFGLSESYPKFFNSKNTPENILKLQNPNPTENVELLSGQFEGDMVLNLKQWGALMGILPRTGLVNKLYRWRNYTVPYELGVEFSSEHKALIRLAISEIEEKTCLKFVPKTSAHRDYISVTGSRTGCWSEVGRQGGRQDLNLEMYGRGRGCFRHGTIVHEFIHALGFYHMQSASDRNKYITIIWPNIESGFEHNFRTYPRDVVSHYGVPYDYGSVMHYPANAFSANGKRTIVTLDKSAEIGQRYHMTASDTKRINKMYGCFKINNKKYFEYDDEYER